MSARLDWRIGPGGEEPLSAPRPEAVLPRRARRRIALTPGLLAAYLAALAAAGLLGFGLGRSAEARTALAAELERQLTLETLAWRQADEGLLLATLHPSVPAAWRDAQLAAFRAAAPLANYQVELVDFALVGPREARVNVRGSRLTEGHSVERRYRATGGRWYRAGD
jgi:hypothetical protein